MEHHQFAILLPLVVGAGAVECTIFIHALAVATTVNVFRYEKRRGHLGVHALKNFAILALVISVAFTAHLVEIGLWAVVLVLCGEFQEFTNAYYHSAVNYATLGYGDLLLTPAWRLLGPLEANQRSPDVRRFRRDGLAIVQRLVQARFEDLRN